MLNLNLPKSISWKLKKQRCFHHPTANPPHVITYSNNLLLANFLQYLLWILQNYLLPKECVYLAAILLPRNYWALLPTPSLPAGRAGFPSACVWPFCLLVLDKHRRCCGLAWPAPWLSKVLLFCKSFSAAQPRDPFQNVVCSWFSILNTCLCKTGCSCFCNWTLQKCKLPQKEFILKLNEIL